jgi:hypothetical protein
MNINSNFVYTMMQNTLAPKCEGQWVQMCVHQLQSNTNIHVGASLGPSLGVCQKKDLDFWQNLLGANKVK